MPVASFDERAGCAGLLVGSGEASENLFHHLIGGRHFNLFHADDYELVFISTQVSIVSGAIKPAYNCDIGLFVLLAGNVSILC